MDVAPLKQSQADKTTPDKETSLLQGLTEQLEYKAGNACDILKCLVY
jgi:hypothetical protein